MSNNFTAVSEVGGTANSITGVLPVVIVVTLLVGFAGLLLVAYRNLEAYERLRGWARFLGATPALAIMGLVGLAPFAVLGLGGYLLATAPTGTSTAVLKWLGMALGAYVGLVGWGFLTRKVIKRFQAHRDTLKARETDDSKEARAS